MSRGRLRFCLSGMAIGQAVWAIAYLLGFFVLEAIEPWQPQWVQLRFDLIDTLGSWCMAIAAPYRF